MRAPPLRSMRLGLLPLRDPHAPRSINIIKQPGHEVWSKTTGPELRDFLQVGRLAYDSYGWGRTTAMGGGVRQLWVGVYDSYG